MYIVIVSVIKTISSLLTSSILSIIIINDEDYLNIVSVIKTTYSLSLFQLSRLPQHCQCFSYQDYLNIVIVSAIKTTSTLSLFQLSRLPQHCHCFSYQDYLNIVNLINNGPSMDDYYNRIVAFLNEYYGDLNRVHIDELFGTSHNSLKLEDLTSG